MSTTIVRFDGLATRHALTRLRREAALLRTLLDELDRIAPPAGLDAGTYTAAQLAEEVARLGCRMLECAIAIVRDGAFGSVAPASALRRSDE
jgi:hypothetical protein